LLGFACKNRRDIMKRLLLGAVLAAAAISASAQVSISVGQPNFFGRIDMGGFAPAPQVYGPPVLASGYYNGPPVYLRVPVDHRRHWGRYCRYYSACGERVFFVRDDWYANSYVPRYREHYRHGGPGWRGDGPRFHGGGPGRGFDHDRGGFDRGRGGFDHDRGGFDHGRGGPGRGEGGFHGGGGRGEHNGGGGRGGDHGGGNHGGGGGEHGR
jgi:hypothetical protein